MPDYQYSKIEKIVDAVRDELVSATANIPWIGAGVVIVSDEPNAAPAMPADRWIVVTPSPQFQYDPAAIGGGAHLQLSTRTRIIVTVHHGADLRDVPDRIDEFFLGTSRSINIDVRGVLKTLTGKNWHDPIPGQPPDWPIDGPPYVPPPPIYYLNDPMLPAEGNWAKAKSGGSVQIAFDIEYDEDLT